MKTQFLFSPMILNTRTMMMWHGCEWQWKWQWFCGIIIWIYNIWSGWTEQLSQGFEFINRIDVTHRIKTEGKDLHKKVTKVVSYFNQINGHVYCNSVAGVLLCIFIQHSDANSWRLFIDSSKLSSKFVLVYNTNVLRNAERKVQTHQIVKGKSKLLSS